MDAIKIPAEITFTPIGCRGPAQHTRTLACDGLHDPGLCPPSQQPITITIDKA